MIHCLLALDNQEGLVEHDPVDKEVVFCFLHFHVNEPSRSCGGEDVQDDFLAQRRAHRYGLVESEGEVLDFVVTFELQDPVQEILECIFAVEEFLEARVELGVYVDLSSQALGNGPFADRLLLSLFCLFHFRFIAGTPPQRRIEKALSML